MAGYELREGSANCFKNNFKEDGDKKPDFTSNMLVNGEERRVAIWKKVTKGGDAYLGVSILPDTFKSAAKPSTGTGFDDMSDDVPF